MAARDLGKPASVGARGSQLAEDAPVPTELQPAIIASTLTLLRAAQVGGGSAGRGMRSDGAGEGRARRGGGACACPLLGDWMCGQPRGVWQAAARTLVLPTRPLDQAPI